MRSSAPATAPPRRRPSRPLTLTTVVAVVLGGLSLLGLSPAAAADTLLLLRDGAVDRLGPRAEVLSGLQAQRAQAPLLGPGPALQAAP